MWTGRAAVPDIVDDDVSNVARPRCAAVGTRLAPGTATRPDTVADPAVRSTFHRDRPALSCSRCPAMIRLAGMLAPGPGRTDVTFPAYRRPCGVWAKSRRPRTS